MDYKHELYHYGILGMKWGIRRYQNKDGTLTPAGRRRYEKAKSTIESFGGRVNKTTKVERGLPKKKPESEQLKDESVKKDPKSMSDEELAKAITRLDNERKYLDALERMAPPKKKKFSDLMVSALNKQLETIPERLMSAGMTYLINSITQPKSPNYAAIASTMSDKELLKAITRAENERRFINAKTGNNSGNNKKK